MLSPKRLNCGRGGHHESATGTTGPGDPWAKRPGDHHRAGRRCGPAHRSDGQDGLCGGARPASPPALEATGVSWGWTAVIWLAYIVTEGDHRKVSVETYIKGMHHTLSHLTAQSIEPLDFSDDRLSHLLTHLSKPAYWHAIERDLNARSIAVYDLSQDVIRCDATTVSGDHEVTEEGLVQFGHSKDDSTRPQIKVMLGSLDPLGMPLATDVLSGERADDGLYIPIMERIRTGLQTTGLLFVGDCKMSALATRAYLARHQDLYLSPLPLTGTTAEAMDAWITAGVTQGEAGK